MNCTHPNCLKNPDMFECHDDCAKCQYCADDEFELTDNLVQNWIDYAKFEYDEDLTEDQAIEQIMKLHNEGCLVEHSDNYQNCPKFDKNCPIK